MAHLCFFLFVDGSITVSAVAATIANAAAVGVASGDGGVTIVAGAVCCCCTRDAAAIKTSNIFIIHIAKVSFFRLVNL